MHGALKIKEIVALQRLTPCLAGDCHSFRYVLAFRAGRGEQRGLEQETRQRSAMSRSLLAHAVVRGADRRR